MKRQWCIPYADAKFVAAMEDVLATYQRAYDALHPLICMDEGCLQLLSSKRAEEVMDVKQARRVDYEYEREGWCSLFVACEPLAGKRVVRVREQRTKKDWAHFMHMVLEEQYPDAEKVVLVMDNLNTHSTASFYEAFEPEMARRLSERLEIHYTPVHGSWLNMAEIELSVLGRQVLGQRMATMQQVQDAVAAWQERRNTKQTCIKWQFTNEQARIKLQRLYPSIEVG